MSDKAQGIWSEQSLVNKINERTNELALQQRLHQSMVWNFELGCMNPYVNFMYKVQKNPKFDPKNSSNKVPEDMKREKDAKTYRMIMIKPSVAVPFKDYIRLKTILNKETSLPDIIIGIDNWEKVKKVLNSYKGKYEFKEPKGDELNGGFGHLFECKQGFFAAERTPQKLADFKWVKINKEQEKALGLVCLDPTGSFGSGKKKVKNYTVKTGRFATNPITKAAVIGLGAAGMRYAYPGAMNKYINRRTAGYIGSGAAAMYAFPGWTSGAVLRAAERGGKAAYRKVAGA